MNHSSHPYPVGILCSGFSLESVQSSIIDMKNKMSGNTTVVASLQTDLQVEEANKKLLF